MRTARTTIGVRADASTLRAWGERWRNLPYSDKQAYEERAKEMRERPLRDLSDAEKQLKIRHLLKSISVQVSCKIINCVAFY